MRVDQESAPEVPKMGSRFTAHTVCLRSSDATEIEQGVFQWDIASQHANAPCARMFLSSIELPMSQYSIESNWSHVPITERLRLRYGQRSFLVREEELSRDDAKPLARRIWSAHMPLHLNRVVGLSVLGDGRVRVLTEHPHALCPATFDWAASLEEHVKIVACAADTVDLSAAFREGRVELPSAGDGNEDDREEAGVHARSILITPRSPLPRGFGGRPGGFLLVPSPPAPKDLASLATLKMRCDGEDGAAPNRRPTVAFDALKCHFSVSIPSYPPGVSRIRLGVHADGTDTLASDIGFAGGEAVASRVFDRYSLDPRSTGYSYGASGRLESATSMASVRQREFLEQHVLAQGNTTAAAQGGAIAASRPATSTPPGELEVRTDASALFGRARLRSGWYAPSQRIYSTSPPLRLHDEWGAALSRFWMPSEYEETSSGIAHAPERGIVFTDPFGVPQFAPVAYGHYTFSGIASEIEAQMNAAVAGSVSSQPFHFTVVFDDATGRFRFSCVSGMGGNAAEPMQTGMQFEINFAHPRSIDAQRFGFEVTTLEGSDEYSSTYVLHEPRSAFGPLRNVYTLSEVVGQRKLCLRATSPPVVSCVALLYRATDPRAAGGAVVSLQCTGPSSNGRRAHGFQEGAVVTLSAAVSPSSHQAAVVSKSDRDDDNTSESKSATSIAAASNVMAVVLAADEPTKLELAVPPVPWIEDAAREGWHVSVSQRTEPHSLALNESLRGTVGGRRLGFASRTLQHGADGTVTTRKRRVPPFISSRVFNMDHVDFVLLRVREGNKTTTMQHQTVGGESLPVWTKVCLNPTFRNERALSVELGFTATERLKRLTVEVLNPDNSPYHFHGAEWSLSVTFVPPE